jgi:hypothetical protein
MPKRRADGRYGGQNKHAQEQRALAFTTAYLTNGMNAAQAALATGAPARWATQYGHELLQRESVKRLLAERAAEVAKDASLSVSAWAAQLRAVLYSDVGDLYGPNGDLLPPDMLPEHVRRAVSVVKSTNGALEYRFWDKIGALQIAARHLGLFEKDNQQHSDVIVKIELVG